MEQTIIGLMRPTDEDLLGIWNNYKVLFEDKHVGWTLQYDEEGEILLTKGQEVTEDTIIAGKHSNLIEHLDTLKNYYSGNWQD